MIYLIPVIGVKTGYRSIIFQNVNTFNREMSNMNTIIKRPIKMVKSFNRRRQ